MNNIRLGEEEQGKMKDIEKLAKMNKSSNILRQYVEECAELILAIQKYKRSLSENLNNGDELIHIAEEIADTEVCKEQLFCCFKEMEKVVDKEKKLKTQRQLKRFGYEVEDNG